MEEIKRLEMVNKHLEDKGKKLIEFIESEIKACDVNIGLCDNYNLKMNWTFYQNALKKVLKKFEKLERVNDENIR